MARSFLAANLEWFSTTSTPITGPPFAMSALFSVNDVDNHYQIISVADASDANQFFNMSARGADGGDPLRAATRAGGSTVFADSTSAVSANTVHHGLAIFVSPTSRFVYLDGGSSAENTVSATPTGIDRIGIGTLARATPTQYMDGWIAEPALWDLSTWPGATDADKAAAFVAAALPALAAGYAPEFFPLGRVLYSRLNRASGNERDRDGGLVLTDNNTVGIADHPRVIYPRRRHMLSIPAAVGDPEGPLIGGKLIRGGILTRGRLAA